MCDLNCNMIAILFIILVFGLIVYYFCSKCTSKKNLDHMKQITDNTSNMQTSAPQTVAPTNFIDNRQKSDEYDDLVDNMFRTNENINNISERLSDNNNSMNIENMDDEQDFLLNKKPFTRKSFKDIYDLYDVEQVLPQEIEQDWFDTQPLQNTKRIKNSNLITPKSLFGVDTKGSSLKNASHDLRGDISNPKITVGPWMNSSIEPDNNNRGFCN